MKEIPGCIPKYENFCNPENPIIKLYNGWKYTYFKCLSSHKNIFLALAPYHVITLSSFVFFRKRAKASCEIAWNNCRGVIYLFI